MTTEQRLAAALDAARRYEPSPDLYRRVVHSIEEDRAHRRRVWITVAVVAAALALGTAIGVLSLRTAPWIDGRSAVDWRVMEALETGALVVLLATLGPAIRRFGRGYVDDLHSGEPGTGRRLLRLLDTAYYLTFSGYILLTTRLVAPASYRLFRLGDQIEEVAARIGGMLATMGVLHAVMLMSLPLVALVYNSTRQGRPLPRWVTIVLFIAAALIAMQLPTLGGLFTLGGGE